MRAASNVRRRAVLWLPACLACLLSTPARAERSQATPPAPSEASAQAVQSARERFTAAALARALGALVPIDEQTGDQPGEQALGTRACPGCPSRHLSRPYLESIGLNILYNAGNHMRGHETANINPSTWWANMKAGFEWDHNPFSVNQMGHPYQGSNYFTAGRANGLSFWESTAVAAFGSATWEFFFENNRASFNDLINTTLGGIALGEVLHRTAWLVRDTVATGKRRTTTEILAAAIDPITGATRFASRDASRVVEKPPGMVPSKLGARLSAGGIWQGSSWRSAQTARPYFDIALAYGDVRGGRSHVPYEAFVMDLTFGGGSFISQFVARGRYYGQPVGHAETWQFTVLQSFDYLSNSAYVFGGQGFEGEIAATRAMASGGSLRMSATGGATVLAAVDSLIPAPPDAGDPTQVFIDPESRTYDYGPGFRFSGAVNLAMPGWMTLDFRYQFLHIAVVDGFRSNHVLQRAFLDVRAPIRSRVAVGVAGEYFFRKAYFWVGAERTDQSPQFRVYLAWPQP